MSGLAYSPPLYYFNGIDYNEAFFVNQNGSTLSKAYLDSTYLLRVGVANSTATITNFSGLVSISQLLTASGGLQVTSGLSCDTGSATTSFSAPAINGTSVSLYSNFINLSVTNLSVTTLTLTSLTLSSLTATGTITAQNFNATSTGGVSNFYAVSVTGNLGATNIISSPTGNFTNGTINTLTSTQIINSNISTLSNLFLLGSNSTTIATAPVTQTGLKVGFNNAGTGNGCTDLMNSSGSGTGGFNFLQVSNTTNPKYLASCLSYAQQGLWLYSNCGRLRIDDRNGGSYWSSQSQEGGTLDVAVNGVNTIWAVDVGDSAGVISRSIATDYVTVAVYRNLAVTGTGTASSFIASNALGTSNFYAVQCSTLTSTGLTTASSYNATNSAGTSNFWGIQTGNVNVSGFTTFNVNHPTTSLGNNISTNTTQYATVGFVNANSAGTLLTANNTWTGTNSFTQNQISIGSGVQVYVGNSIGNQQSIVIGDPTSLATTTISSNCISIGTMSLRLSTGSNNLSFGTANLTVLSSGNNNIAIGTSSGGGVTTGNNNILIGNSSWSTGANFSNCIVIGNVVPAPLSSNSIILGSTETVYINGTSQLNNTLLYGTTVVGSNIQVNGNIIQPIQTFTAGVLTTFTTLPPFVFFTPAPSGMSFVWPAPSAGNSGQTFTIRRIATGSGVTINNTITGGISAWWTTSGSAPIANIAISTVWSFTFISNGSGYYQIA